MSDILFVALEDAGHLYPLFKPARSLVAHGHRVAFVTFDATAQALIERHGFSAELLFRDDLATDDTRRRFAESWRKRPMYKPWRRELDRIIATLAAEVLKVSGRPDLVLMDKLFSPGHLALADAGARVALVATNFPNYRDRTHPPISSDVVPNTRWWRLRSATAWLSYWWRYEAVRSYDMPFAEGLRRRYWRAGVDPRDGFVELVLSCRELDYPDVVDHPGTVYVGPAVDLERPIDVDFPWDRIAPDRPLVYASLGSMAHIFPAEEARARRIILEAVASRPDWQVVYAGNDIGPVPDHVLAVSRAPQIEVLRRASVMITHGGFNSLKECILMGVPMVMVPLVHDQPGNAARVAFHGLGRKASLRVSAGDLRSMIEDVLVDPGYRERVGKMKIIFEQAEAEDRFVPAVEAILADVGGRPNPALDLWRELGTRR